MTTNMCISATDAKGVDADSLGSIRWPGHRLDRHLELLLGKWNCRFGKLVVPTSNASRRMPSGELRDRKASFKPDILLGFGSENLMFGGIVLCSRARIDFIRLVRPDAPSECPTFGLTLQGLVVSTSFRPRFQGVDGGGGLTYRSDINPVLPKNIANRCRLDWISRGRSGPVTLDYG